MNGVHVKTIGSCCRESQLDVIRFPARLPEVDLDGRCGSRGIADVPTGVWITAISEPHERPRRCEPKRESTIRKTSLGATDWDGPGIDDLRVESHSNADLHWPLAARCPDPHRVVLLCGQRRRATWHPKGLN